MTKMARKPVPRIRKGRRMDVRRDEFNNLVDMLNQRGEVLNGVLRELRLQFERIAQLQAQLDRLEQQLAAEPRRSRVS